MYSWFIFLDLLCKWGKFLVHTALKLLFLAYVISFCSQNIALSQTDRDLSDAAIHETFEKIKELIKKNKSEKIQTLLKTIPVHNQKTKSKIIKTYYQALENDNDLLWLNLYTVKYLIEELNYDIERKTKKG